MSYCSSVLRSQSRGTSNAAVPHSSPTCITLQRSAAELLLINITTKQWSFSAMSAQDMSSLNHEIYCDLLTTVIRILARSGH